LESREKLVPDKSNQVRGYEIDTEPEHSGKPSKEFESFEKFLEGGRRGAPLTNSISRAPMTRARLQSLILQGFGQSRGDDYIPWIRVTRGNAPRMSNHFVAVVSTQATPPHLLSDLEYCAARVASWLGADEIRAQFPLFPWAGHPHPMAGLDAKVDAALPATRGLLEIAQEAGIKHGTYIGSSGLPYVATTDLLITAGAPKAKRLVFWSVKPAEVMAEAKPGSRVLQRIRLEELYAQSVGGKHVVYDGTHVSVRLISNLEWLEPPRQERTDAFQTQARIAFVEQFNERGDREPLGQRIESAAEQAGMSTPDGQRHFRAAAWLGQLDIDLAQPVLMSRPTTCGGQTKKHALRIELLGEAE
jgi:hypothetical protein